MAGTYVRVDSGKALRYLQQVRDTARRWGRSRTVVGSDLPYAFGIESGRTRRGRLARRAGGAYMMRQGLEDAKPRIRPLIVSGFEQGPSIVPLAEANIGRMVVASIRKYTPVGKTGNLRDSFRPQTR
jgi:hypothetical protein